MTGPGSTETAAGQPDAEDRIVVLGTIVGTFGVQGWVKINSHTEPLENILEYETLQLGRAGNWTPAEVEDGRVTGKGVLAKLKGIDSPEVGRTYVGAELGVRRGELPPSEPGEHYWSDLEGLDALTANGDRLGSVDHFRSTPAGVVVVIEGERQHWIPFVKERIVKVDLDAGCIVFDWEVDWS